MLEGRGGRRPGLLVAGTASDAGKSMVTTGLCRALARRGISVAPGRPGGSVGSGDFEGDRARLAGVAHGTYDDLAGRCGSVVWTGPCSSPPCRRPGATVARLGLLDLTTTIGEERALGLPEGSGLGVAASGGWPARCCP